MARVPHTKHLQESGGRELSAHTQPSGDDTEAGPEQVIFSGSKKLLNWQHATSSAWLTVISAAPTMITGHTCRALTHQLNQTGRKLLPLGQPSGTPQILLRSA